jgi:nucleoside-diphosphate-sugar epimerase
MRVLITGNEGFVGKYFHKRLGPDHDITGIDIKNGIDCRDFFKKDDSQYDLVIHLAAIVGGRQTILRLLIPARYKLSVPYVHQTCC